MKYRISITLFVLLILCSFTACQDNQSLSRFRKEMDDFCDRIVVLDTSMNEVNPASETATEDLLVYLDELELEFQRFAAVSFPEEFDYLEHLADDASTFMTDAVNAYHELFASELYDDAQATYAAETYSRAYKCIQMIITIMHGEEPNDPDFTIEYRS